MDVLTSLRLSLRFLPAVQPLADIPGPLELLRFPRDLRLVRFLFFCLFKLCTFRRVPELNSARHLDGNRTTRRQISPRNLRHRVANGKSVGVVVRRRSFVFRRFFFSRTCSVSRRRGVVHVAVRDLR